MISISDRKKNSSEQLTDDSRGIPDSSQINTVPSMNTLFWTYQLNFTENLCGSKSKENKLIPSLNTDTPQFSENSTIQSIPTDCTTTPQLANIVGKLSTNQDMKKTEA